MACRVRVPQRTRNPGAIRDLLDRIAQHRVASPCGEALSSLNLGDEVVRIKRLGVEFWVDLEATPEADVALRWGAALAASIKDAILRGGLSNVRRFDSPQDFVTSFLRDLLDGAAWDRWYYDEFLPLRSLQTQEIAVQMLQARPTWIVSVFAQLEPTGHRERLIERLTVQDLRQLWAALGLSWNATPSFSPAESNSVRILAALWPKVAMARGPDSESRAKDRFRLLLAAAESPPNEPLAKAVRAMVDIAAVVRLYPDLGPVLSMGSGLYPAAERRISASLLADVVPWLEQASATAEGRSFTAHVAEAVGPGPGPLFSSGATADGQETADGRRPIQADQSPAQDRGTKNDAPVPPGETSDDGIPEGFAGPTNDRSAVEPASDSPWTSPIGSVFLVCPALAELGLWELWNDEVGEASARLYVFAVALKALGRENALQSLNDPVLAMFAGLGDTPGLNGLADVQGNSPAEWPAAIPQIASKWYPAHERDLVWDSASGVDVLRDAAAGLWLGARPMNPGRAPSAGIWTVLQVDETAVRNGSSDQKTQGLINEAAHFQLGGDLGYPWLTPSLDADLSVVTSLVLRRTAEQLPGFGRSGPAYLARQFLAQPATLDLDSHGLTVRLGGGPLGVVLRLAVFPTETEIPWLPYPLSLAAPYGYGSLA